MTNEISQNKEDNNQEEKNEEVSDDDIPIAHIMKNIIECVFKPQDKNIKWKL